MFGHRDQYCLENCLVRNVHDDDDDNNKGLLMLCSMLNVAIKKLIHKVTFLRVKIYSPQLLELE
jgi:hypothetical protein